eukprot:Selendium_serpulae@DN6481_c0_g1_i1.p1
MSPSEKQIRNFNNKPKFSSPRGSHMRPTIATNFPKFLVLWDAIGFTRSFGRRGHGDNTREVRIPDVSPGEYVSPNTEFSMCAGEFVEVYYNQKAEWDGVLTCFFLDTAKNVILYVRTIANIIREGGLWANFGPLLYHYAETPREMSVELSWEELKTVIQQYFTIVKEEWCDSYYTTNELSMMQVQYHCISFEAIRNGKEVQGFSKPVF